MNLLKPFIKNFSAFLFILLFLIKPGLVLSACVECERDNPGICNLYSATPQFNAMVGRYCGSNSCTFFDACAPHTQSGASCDGSRYTDLDQRLIRLSTGEWGNGSFVGCNANNQSENCFCNSGASVGGSVSGTVRCMYDNNEDSCGARESCTPNCDCAASTCVGQDCPNGCGWWCDGTKQPNCSCAVNTCAGQTCSDGCGGTCAGTRAATCSYSSWQNIANPTCGGNTQFRTGTATCGANCPTQYQGCNECQTCAKACGQARNCGGNCLNTLCGDPSAPTNLSPNNPQSNPYISLNPTITLSWTNPVTPNGFDGFRINIHDTTTVWNAGLCSTGNKFGFCQNLSSGVHSLTFPTSGSMIPDHLYHWWIYATKSNNCAGIGTCSGDDGWSPLTEGYFLYHPNLPPTFTDITIKNSSDVIVPPETGNRNHICQTIFNGNRIPTFTVTATDPDGVSDITDIRLRWNGHEFTRISLSNGVAVFIEDLNASLNNGNTYPLEVNITDSVTNSTGWVNTARLFKIWNCQVPTEGVLYDGSSEPLGPTCNASSFTTPINSGLTYTLSYLSGTNKTMTVNSPNYSSDSSNHLTWGKTYSTIINLPGSAGQMRTTDLGENSVGTVCPNSLLNLALDNSHVNPYSLNPRIKADFSTIIEQENWYQTVGGGINTISNLTDLVPVTCNEAQSCINAVSINNIDSSSNNGPVISRTYDKGDSSSKFGNPNNWYISLNRTGLNDIYDFNYFYDQYSQYSVPLTYYDTSVNLSSISSDIGGTGIILVNGNVTIDSNNNLDSDQLLMIVAKNQIIFNSNITHSQGVFLADQGITASGSDANQLVIDGIVYSPHASVLFNRTFNPKSQNNTTPSVLINYQPNLIFKLPLELIQVFSIHQYGI